MANMLRARFDVIVVLEVEIDEDSPPQAVQYEFATNLRDQLELTRRFPKIEDDPGSAPVKLAYLAAQRTGCSVEGETFDEWVDRTLDFQLEEAPPLTKG